MFFQKVRLSITSFSCHSFQLPFCQVPLSQQPGKLASGSHVKGREGKLSQGQLHLSSLSFSRGVCAQIKDEGGVNWSIPHASHHRLQGYYQKDLEQSSITFAEAAAPYNVALKTTAAKHIISKGHLPKATDQKITDTQHGLRTENYKMSRLSFSQVNKFSGNGGTEEIFILEQ